MHRRTLALLTLLPAALGAQAPAKWRLVPEVTYGASDASEAELEQVRDFEVAKNGNVLVVDAKAHSVKLFAPTGKFLKSLGRSGAGPGEYAQPNGIALGPDGTLWVHDPKNNRLTQLRDDGTLVGTTPIVVNSWGWTWDGAFDRQGRLVSQVLSYDKEGKSRYVLSRMTYPANRGDSVPTYKCTPPDLKGPAHRPWMEFQRKDGKGGGSIAIPFAPSETQTVHPAGYLWCANGARYQVYRLDLVRGDTLSVVRGTAVPIPVSKVERDSAIGELRKFAATYGEMNPDLSRVPSTQPALTALHVDDRDRLWVQLTPFEAKEARFDVFNLAGQRVASATMPGRLKMMPTVIRGDKVYAIVEDEDGMATIARYRIEVAR